jgi:hypothetical protein
VNDDLAEVAATRPAVRPPDAETLSRERASLLQFIAARDTGSSQAPSVGRVARARRRRWVVPGVAVAALLTAAAGWAITRTAADTVITSCRDGNVIKVVTADPVADCAARWPALFGTPAPTLVAYETPDNNVVVLAGTDPVPEGWRRLDPGFRQNESAAELSAALADPVTGIAAPSCYSTVDAAAIVERLVDEYGLEGWTVKADAAQADGAGSCARYGLDLDSHAVRLSAIPTDHSGKGPAITGYISAAKERVDGACLDLPSATKELRLIATELGLSEKQGELSILPIETLGAACSKTQIELGGHLMVTVRGPSAP